MQEYYLTLKNIKDGLRATEETYRHTGQAQQACNLIPNKLGLGIFSIKATCVNTPAHWPFPMMYDTSHGILLCSVQGPPYVCLYDVGSSGMQTIDIIDDTYFPSAAPWYVAQVGDFVLCCQDNKLYYLKPKTKELKVAPSNMSDSVLPMTKLGIADFYKQQLFYWNTDPFTVLGTLDADQSYIAWATPGKINIELSRRNSAGFMYLPEVGQVLMAHQVGRAMAVLGSKGVAILQRWKGGGWGKRMVHDVGIINHSAVAGPYDVIYFVDRESALWSLGPESIKRLDYREHLKTLNHPILTYDALYRRVIITDEDKHYMYDIDNASMTGPNSLDMQANGNKEAFWFTNTQPMDIVAEYVSDVLDMNRSGYKTLRWIQPTGNVGETSKARLEYRYDIGEDNWHTTEWLPLRPHNSVHFGITAPEFRVCINSEDPNFRLDKIGVRWQPEDRRFIRGTSEPIQHTQT